MKKVEMYCMEEKCKYTTAQLEQNKERMVQFCREKLNEFCANKEYSSYIFTLAMWPLELTKEQIEKLAEATK